MFFCARSGLFGTDVGDGDAAGTVWDKAEEFIRLAPGYGINLVTAFALDLDRAFNEEPLKEEFVTIRAAILFPRKAHSGWNH